ncbi:hypothetical protein HZS_2804 [Henneguya salminicola]|nr:hypothetical protein HZS_2804 [Henneguya salminicola]
MYGHIIILLGLTVSCYKKKPKCPNFMASMNSDIKELYRSSCKMLPNCLAIICNLTTSERDNEYVAFWIDCHHRNVVIRYAHKDYFLMIGHKVSLRIGNDSLINVILTGINNNLDLKVNLIYPSLGINQNFDISIPFNLNHSCTIYNYSDFELEEYVRIFLKERSMKTLSYIIRITNLYEMVLETIRQGLGLKNTYTVVALLLGTFSSLLIIGLTIYVCLKIRYQVRPPETNIFYYNVY